MVKSFLFFLAMLVLGAAITVYTQRPSTPPAKAVSEMILPTPTQEPKVQTRTSEVAAPNGDKKLTMRMGGLTYDFYVGDKRIYTKTVQPGTTMSLPFNAWDPTEKRIFIEEKTGKMVNYFIMKETGEDVIDVGAVWTAKQIGYTIRTATGWASDTLLIIYTSKDDGSRGPAFWFEVPSTAILQLAG